MTASGIFIPLYIFLLLVITALTFLLISDIHTWYHLPKGPRPTPFIGNALTLPRYKPWITFKEMARVYGPIYTVWAGRNPMLMVTDPAIAHKLLTRRGNKYSSRPRSVVFGELFSRGAIIIMQPYGHDWSLRRKLIHSYVRPSSLAQLHPHQEAEASRLALEVLHNSDSWRKGLERFTASIVFSMAYGRRIDDLESRALVKTSALVKAGAKFIEPGAYLAEYFPFLARLPECLAGWKRHVREQGDESAAWNRTLVEAVEQDLIKKTKDDSEATNLTQMMLAMKIDGSLPSELRDTTQFAAVPGVMFGAGSDTTYSTLLSAVLGLLTHPDVFLAAQKEIDDIVGPKRSPTFDDKPKLPYLEAIVKETSRWRPAIPINVPHASSEADVYEGWTIPAGTSILINIHAINSNELYFPQPALFAPERYLAPADPRYRPELTGKLTFPSREGQSGFGWGRRICPGADLAEDGMFIALAKLIWAFELINTGNVMPDLEDEEGYILRPKEFACRFKVRGERYEEVVEREGEDARKVLGRFPAFE